MYKNVKIQRFTLHENARDDFDSEADFDLIDGFKDFVAPYIFTDILMTDWHDSIEKAFQSRLQILMSSVLLRALLLKNGLVISLNENNFPSFYADLKSFLEVPALLGYLTYEIYHDSDYNSLIPKINKISLGNRSAGNFEVGTVKQLSVLTMFEKFDRVIKDMAVSDHKITVQEEGILKTMYEDVCNFGHINYNAHLSIGRLGLDNIWRAKRDVDGYKEELYGFYMPGFIMAIEAIFLSTSLIMRNPKVKNFSLLTNQSYFI